MHGLDLVSGDTVISLEREGFVITGIRVNLPDQENLYEELDGISGRFFQGAVHKQTTIEVDVEYNFDFDLDFPLFRDKLTGLVSSTKPFYIREKTATEMKVLPELPGQKTGGLNAPAPALSNGKQYLVLRSGAGAIEKAALQGSGTITFETAYLPYAESVYTTMDIHNNGIQNDGKWSYGMGLYVTGTDETGKDRSYTWKYRHTSSPFVIYNAGDNTIDDWRMYRKIKITLSSSTSQLRLYDMTGNYLEVNKALYSGDVILVDGPRVFLNGVNILTSTNGYFPILYKGDNTLRVTGPSSFTVEFDFRYYYGSTDITKLNSTPVLVSNDTTPPSPPTVYDIDLGTTVLKGKTEEGALVTATFANGVKATATAGVDGSFGVTKPASVTLVAGQTVSFTATDRAGNVSGSTTATIRAYQHSAPVVNSYNVATRVFTVSNLPLVAGESRYLMYQIDRNNDYLTGGLKSIGASTETLDLREKEPDYTPASGDKVSFWIEGPGDEDLSATTVYTINVTTSESSALNKWRSSNKDFSSTLNSTGSKQITEVLTVVGNSAQQVDVKTSGDSMTIDGNAGDMRFYTLNGLKPNTDYTLSYNVTWSDSSQGLHTHAWGVGVLNDSLKGTRRKFTFRTNAQGKYGYGNGATMDPPASSILNAMNASVNGNVVVYSNITLNEGTVDLGYTAGTATGV